MPTAPGRRSTISSSGRPTSSDRGKREALLHQIQKIVADQVLPRRSSSRRSSGAWGPRVEEGGAGLIPGFPYSAPGEDLKLKAPGSGGPRRGPVLARHRHRRHLHRHRRLRPRRGQQRAAARCSRRHDDPARGGGRRRRGACSRAGAASTPARVARVVHATTLFTNALIERKGALHRPHHHRGLPRHARDRPRAQVRALRPVHRASPSRWCRATCASRSPSASRADGRDRAAARRRGVLAARAGALVAGRGRVDRGRVPARLRQPARTSGGRAS